MTLIEAQKDWKVIYPGTTNDGDAVCGSPGAMFAQVNAALSSRGYSQRYGDNAAACGSLLRFRCVPW